MSIFSRKPSALEALRAAQANLEKVKQTAPQERIRAIQNAKHHGNAEWHPCEDTAAQLIAEAELKVAEASVAYSVQEPEGVGLCSALDAALVATRDALALIVDAPEPTLASTPEARAEYEQRSAEHNELCKANVRERASIIAGAATHLGKAAQASPRMLDQIDSIVADTRGKLAAVVDPEAPQLGDVSATTVAALSKALAVHRASVEANEAKREAIRADLVPVVRSISDALSALRAKRQEQGLPSPSMFKGVVSGQHPSLEHCLHWILNGAYGVEIDRYRAAIGCPSNGVESPRAVLAEIAMRKRGWEKLQAAKAEAAKRANGKDWGRDHTLDVRQERGK